MGSALTFAVAAPSSAADSGGSALPVSTQQGGSAADAAPLAPQPVPDPAANPDPDPSPAAPRAEDDAAHKPASPSGGVVTPRSTSRTTLAAAATASLSGTVTLPAGVSADQGSTWVYVYKATEEFETSGSAWVENDGTFVVNDLAPGSYKVEFTSWDRPVFDEWWNDQPDFDSATTITLASGQARTGIDATLSKSATISGTVTFPVGVDSSSGYTDVSVYTAGGEYVTSGWVDEEGDYLATGLSAGDYKVKFDASGLPVVDEWWDDAADQASATVLTLASGEQRTGIDATLAQGASISGKVTFPNGFDTSKGSTEVDVYTADDGYSAGYASVGADGTFRVDGLPAGDYKVRFSSWERALLDEWWNDKTDFDSATTVTVTTGQALAGINAALAKSATISGKVTFPSGISLSSGHTTVSASPTGGSGNYESAYVNSDGTYRITGLTAGSYKVYFSPYGVDVLGEYWDNKVTWEDATIITLAAGGSKTGVSASLAKASSVSGKVTFPAGTVRSDYDTSVQIYSTTDSNSYLTSGSVAANGTYKVSGLAAGTYKVKFSTTATGAASEWWDNKTTFAAASKLTLTAGQAKTGVNATLGADATISGVLSYPEGTERSSSTAGYITALAASDQSYAGSTYTDAEGNYSIAGLAPGSYKLVFYPDEFGFALEWWNDKVDFQAATAVTLTANQDKTGINATFGRGASISGTVTGGQLADGYGGAIAYRLSSDGTWDFEYWVALRGEGEYTIPGLRPGTYTVQFTDQMGMGGGRSVEAAAEPVEPKTEWWNDKPDQLSATRITLTADQARTGIDADISTTAPATLKTATPTISGTVAVGSKLTAKPGTWTSGTKLAYQWYASGKAISKATKSTFTLTSAQKAKTITVKVTGTKSGYTTASKTSKASVKVATVATPKISGTAKVGKKLTAKPGTWTSGTKFTYQWYASGKAISKATKSTFTLTKSQKGKTITVKVTGKKSGYATVAKTSTATAKVK
ncbi:hypothetical protein GCM10025738_27710 [Microbacterium fluvii]